MASWLLSTRISVPVGARAVLVGSPAEPDGFGFWGEVGPGVQLVGAVFVVAGEILLAYLNRGDLPLDLQETQRQLRQALTSDDTLARSVKT